MIKEVTMKKKLEELNIEIEKLSINESKAVLGLGIPGGTSDNVDSDTCSCCCAEDPDGTSNCTDENTCCCVCGNPAP